MIAPSTYLPSASWSTTAASSIQGTGAQNFSSAMRNGCALVSGVALAPNFASRRYASSPVKPSAGHRLRLVLPIWRAKHLHRAPEQS
jgi:hypothetical protein